MTIAYSPSKTPEDAKALPSHLDNEHRRISAAIKLLSLGHLDVSHAEPARYEDGDIRYADGTNWDPGSGEGLYIRFAGAWNPTGVAVAFTPTYPLLSTAPASPVEGRIYRADGAGWNPGSGRGYYGYDNTTYKFLG